MRQPARILAVAVLFIGFLGAQQVHASLPSPSLSVSPSSVITGQSSTLTWNSGPSSNLNTCWTDGQFSNSYTAPGYWTTQLICAGWFGCFQIPVYVQPQTIENPSGSVTVAPANTTTYSYACNRTETFGIGASCYGYSTRNGWGWGYCWAGHQEAVALCNQRGYATYATYAAGGPGGRVCGGSAVDWSDWRCDHSCKSCGGKTLTSVSCTNPYGAPVTVSATLTVTPPLPDLTASNLGPSSGLVGTAVTFQGRANNVGSGVAGSFNNIFQLDTGALISASSIGSLSSGANSPFSGAYTFSFPGSYQYRACADNNTSWVGTVSETNEGNNCDGWSTITITSPIQCQNGVDDDGDGLTDYPADTGCTGTGDTNETNPPSCSSFSANPESISPGESSTLTWSCSGATSCTGSGTGFSTGGATSGSDTVSPVTSTTYGLSCTGAGGSASVNVTVNLAADIELTPSRTNIAPNQQVTLSWSAENVEEDSCSLTGDNGDSWSLSGSSGSKTSSKLAAQTVYTLACTDLEGEPVSVSTTIRVAPRFEEI